MSDDFELVLVPESDTVPPTMADLEDELRRVQRDLANMTGGTPLEKANRRVMMDMLSDVRQMMQNAVIYRSSDTASGTAEARYNGPGHGFSDDNR